MRFHGRYDLLEVSEEIRGMNNTCSWSRHWMHSGPDSACEAEMRRTLFEAETTDSRGRQRGNPLCRVGTA
jgi:hypothetical protein